MSVIGERNAEILGPQLKLIAQGRSRELDVLPEVGNRDRVSIKTSFESLKSHSQLWAVYKGLDTGGGPVGGSQSVLDDDQDPANGRAVQVPILIRSRHKSAFVNPY